MASASSQSKFVDFKLCSICLATFKVPRCLPCSHSFCHQCLRSYILSTCEQRDAPLGFSCPLCREFVPSPGQPDDTSLWADKFPISDILVQLTDASKGFNVCWACRGENEEEEASDYCLSCKEPLCKLCTKFHRRNLASQNHQMCLISEIESHTGNIIENDDTTFCDKHDGRSIELYCNVHDTPCCAVCISTEHNKCDKLATIEEAAESFQRQSLVESLVYDIERMKNELGEAKQNEEENVLAVDEASERITKEAQQFQKEMICHLNKLMEDYLTDLAKKRKDAIRKLERSKLCISDRIDFLEYLLKVLGSINDKDNKSALKFVLIYNRVREKIDMIANYRISEITFTLSSEVSEELKEIRKLGSVSVLESSRRVCEIANIKKADFSLILESPVVYNKVKGCTFLCDGNILCTDYEKSHCIIFLKTDLENKPVIAFEVGPSAWDIEADNGILYVTKCSYHTTHVQRFSEHNFQALGSPDFGKSCLGITILGEHIYVVSERSCIIKRNKNGEASPEIIYKHEKNGLRYLTSIDNGMIVFSDFLSDSVSALYVTKIVQKAWTYKHAELQGPYGLDKDPSSNIYVTGKKSNNIHILSMNGSLIRILQGIHSPVCIKFKKGTFTCFIARESYSSSNSKVMVYKFV